MTTTKRLTGLAIIISVLMNMFVFIYAGGLSASAKSKTKKAKYSIVKIDKSKKFDSGVTAEVYYNKVQLKGKSKAIKKINKAIEKDYKSFSKKINDIYNYAECTNMEATYYLTAKSKVTYNKNNIISIRITTYWFAGGVSNTDRYGLTFNTKTGKKLGIKSVCNYSTKNLRKTVQNKLKKKYGNELWEDHISNYKEETKNVSKYKFYLNPGKKCVVCFIPYSVGYGGWYRCVTITSKYK
ncbi:MAG: DUF4163 domain-containing protein [Oscillospiraceae bacterium]|nr:DUF4163 domain-containing protein [Oscillospiraceae bacterium]